MSKDKIQEIYGDDFGVDDTKSLIEYFKSTGYCGLAELLETTQ